MQRNEDIALAKGVQSLPVHLQQQKDWKSGNGLLTALEPYKFQVDPMFHILLEYEAR